jgi:quinol monooxygenase YgiN
MPITVFADFRFRPDAIDDGLRSLGEILPDTRAFQGILRLDVIQDQSDPGHVVLVEEWESPDDHTAYMAWRAESGTSAEMRAALAAAPVVSYFDQRSDL